MRAVTMQEPVLNNCSRLCELAATTQSLARDLMCSVKTGEAFK